MSNKEGQKATHRCESVAGPRKGLGKKSAGRKVVFEKYIVIHIILLAVGFALRILGSCNQKVVNWSHYTTEISSFRNSWTELKEANYLLSIGTSLRDMRFLQSPLLVVFANIIPDRLEKILFLCIECAIIFYLSCIVKLNHGKQREFEEGFQDNTIEQDVFYQIKDNPLALDYISKNIPKMRQEDDYESPEKFSLRVQRTVEIFYALNPFSIMACIAKSVSTITSLFTVMSIHYALKGKVSISFIFLAVSCYLSLYNIAFIFPIILVLMKTKSLSDIAKSGYSFLGTSLALILGSSLVFGGWEFTRQMYASIFVGDDTTPDLGLMWYFNIQVFPEYLKLFTISFFCGTIIVSAILATYFRADPLFCILAVSLLISVVKVDQTASDAALTLSFLSMYLDELYTKTSASRMFIFLITYPSCCFIYIARYIWVFMDNISPNYVFFSNTYFNGMKAILLLMLVKMKRDKISSLENRAVIISLFEFQKIYSRKVFYKNIRSLLLYILICQLLSLLRAFLYLNIPNQEGFPGTVHLDFIEARILERNALGIYPALTLISCKHIINAQVSIRAPCCRQWFDCPDCHKESEDHVLRKTTLMVFGCKKCKAVFRKDMCDYEEADEYCPRCDNKYVLPAITPQPAICLEGTQEMIRDHRMKQQSIQQ